MKLTLIPKPHYEVRIGDTVIGTFCKQSEWNGMVELRHDSKGTLIVEAGQGGTRFINEVFSGEMPVTLVKVSTNLEYELNAAFNRTAEKATCPEA